MPRTPHELSFLWIVRDTQLIPMGQVKDTSVLPGRVRLSTDPQTGVCSIVATMQVTTEVQ